MLVQFTSIFSGAYPTHIAVPFEQGKIHDLSYLYLEGVPIQPVVAALWPDGSVKWAHIYGLFEFKNYDLTISNTQQQYDGLTIIDGKIDTGIYHASFDQYGQLTIDRFVNLARSFMIDERQIQWQFEGTTECILKGPICAIYKLNGWYQSDEKRVAAFVKQTTYITFFYNSSYIKISHASTFADNMNDHSIFMLGYMFPKAEIIPLLIARDLGQKFPNFIDNEENVFCQWPGSTEISTFNETEPQEIYKFKYLSRGPLLTTRMPNEYLRAWDSNKDTTECKAEYARAANMQGLSLHNDLCLVLDRTNEINFYLNPIGIIQNVDSKVFGPINITNESNETDNLVTNGIHGCEKSYERFAAYGAFIFGNQFSDELLKENRPSLHHCWSNNHYQACSIMWLHTFRSCKYNIIRYARRITDYYASIGMIRYDEPEIRFHQLGAFYNCKGVLPWGSRAYGMDDNDIDADLIGHWPDPSSLLYSWLIDANYWHKDGYDLWTSNVKPYTEGSNRDVNTTLVHTLTLFEYTHNQALRTNIEGMINDLITSPLSIWEPTWLSRYYEYNPNNISFNNFVLRENEVQYENVYGIALNLLAYKISNDRKYVDKLLPIIPRMHRLIAFFGPLDLWNYYNIKPGPLTAGDLHFTYQWPRLAKVLEDENITVPTKWEEIGNYGGGACRWDAPWDCEARGTHIAIRIPEAGSFTVTIDATTVSSGDIQATSLKVQDPNEQLVLDIPQLLIGNKKIRPSTWRIDREVYEVTAAIPGIYTIIIGSNEIALCGKLTEFDEAQYLQARDKTGTNEEQIYFFKICQMFCKELAECELTFTTYGNKNPCSIDGKFYKPGQTITMRPPSQFNIHCEGDAYVKMIINSVEKYPLLIATTQQELLTFNDLLSY